jgi:hypothetical protein
VGDRLDITASRLRNQRLTGGRFATPEQVVGWMGAVQAQDYIGAKWALALRMRRGTDAVIERALERGTILRTHVLRPTWHFVASADIRWMLTLTAPRIQAAMASYNRRLELDAAVFRRSQTAIVRALRGGIQLTRQELKTVLARAGIRADGVQRLAHIVMQAELDAVVCSGVRRGKQVTYALLDERVPASRTLSRDAALAELARRYFTSHGPAQLHDFAWWSGLTVGDARAGLAMVERQLASESVNGRTYWFSSSARTRTGPPRAYLLPLYDEYLIAYKDRTAAMDRARWTRIAERDPFSAPVVVDGQVVGAWGKALRRNEIVVTLTPFCTVGTGPARAIRGAAHAYAEFVDLDLQLCWT